MYVSVQGTEHELRSKHVVACPLAWLLAARPPVSREALRCPRRTHAAPWTSCARQRKELLIALLPPPDI